MSEIIGKKIKAKLDSMGKTLEWLAEQVPSKKDPREGVSINAVSKWIKTGKIARENVPYVAKALNMTASELLDDSIAIPSTMPSTVNAPGWTCLERVDMDEFTLIQLFREANKYGKGSIISAAESAPKEAYLSGTVRDKLQ